MYTRKNTTQMGRIFVMYQLQITDQLPVCCHGFFGFYFCFPSLEVIFNNIYKSGQKSIANETLLGKFIPRVFFIGRNNVLEIIWEISNIPGKLFGYFPIFTFPKIDNLYLIKIINSAPCTTRVYTGVRSKT